MRDFVKVNRKIIVWFITGIIVLANIFLIIFNFSLFETFQINYRNDIRRKDLDNIKSEIERFINETKNCPRTSTPLPNTYLPELLVDDKGNPRGGVSIATLEEADDFIDIHRKDPKGSPYLIGVMRNYIIIYTLDYELGSGRKTTYSISISTDLCNALVNRRGMN
ncbi:MAG: hypothetical protein KatS3mg084_0332 [Candidatus Dojkabacteria bacterium]|jgi:hypothetical protein|nr:MAG: hypothetical protein KatS3mg084_0332 [Candidatus Dojkabacteria bacterium]